MHAKQFIPQLILKKGGLLTAAMALFIAISLLSLRKIHLITADLGRHIANGRALLNHGDVVGSNHYSYTFPDFPFVNHHWGSGLIFYIFHEWMGFEGLSFLHVFVTLSAFALIFLMSWRLTSLTDTLLASFIVLPLIVARTEIRPEMFSYLFIGTFYFILSQWRTGGIREEWLASLPLLMMIWVNLHILFFMGAIVIAVFILDTRDPNQRKNLATILALTFIATFVNPKTWEIALYPLKIFENYGYKIAENQSVLFFWKRENIIPGFFSFHATTLALALSMGILALLKTPFSRAFVVLSFGTWLLALSAIRNFTLFGLCAIPTLAMVGYILDATRLRLVWRIGFILIALFCNTLDGTRLAPVLQNMWGIGLANHVNASASFFKDQKLKGPIFNNYDIGGYLIYHLFPEERVFVDNRPEAYPAGFFEDIYVPMQDENRIWRAMEDRFGFNTIFFYLRDNTPAGQNFLIARVKDPRWVPVFVDTDSIIFVRNIQAHREIIERFALPPDMFRVSRN